MKGLPTERQRFYADLVRIALPIALQNLVVSGVNMLDTIMVGRLGTAELAAVGLANQIWFLLILMLFGVATGGGVFTAQYWGKRDIAGIRRTTGLSLVIGLGAGLAFMAGGMLVPQAILGFYSRDPEVIGLGASYLRIVAPSYPLAAISFVFSISLRGVERVRLPLVATVISLTVNAILNYVLIFGAFGAPAMGVDGAAVATVVSRLIEAAIVITGAYTQKTAVAGSLKEFTSWGSGFITRFLGIAMPVIINEIAWSVGITTYNGIFARVGTGAIAAFNVTSTVNQLAMVFFMGTANAAAVMIGSRIGAGEVDVARHWARRFAILSPLYGLCMSALMVPSVLLLPLLFVMDPEPLRQASIMILVMAGVFPFKIFNLHVIVGICRSGGDTRFGAFFDIFGIWGIGVPLALLGAFVLKLQPWQVFLLLNLEESTKAILGVWRVITGKWLNDVTA